MQGFYQPKLTSYLILWQPVSWFHDLITQKFKIFSHGFFDWNKKNENFRIILSKNTDVPQLFLFLVVFSNKLGKYSK